MNAMKNLVHGAVLLGWAAVGALFSLRVLFGEGASFVARFLEAGSFWLWFALLAAGTTYAVTKVKTPIGALFVHGLVGVVLLMLPHTLPFGWLRLGLDLIGRA